MIVTVRTGPAMTTANLKAPLIVNLRTRKGVQLIIDDSQYSTKYPLWQENPQQKQDTKDKKDKFQYLKKALKYFKRQSNFCFKWELC